MSFQICIKTEKSLQQLATEIRDLFSLPPFRQEALAGEPYCQFEVLGLLVLIHHIDEGDRDPEVMHYPYSFDLQMAFVDHKLDTDDLEYRLQAYYAQLLSFSLGLDTAHHEPQRERIVREDPSRFPNIPRNRHFVPRGLELDGLLGSWHHSDPHSVFCMRL